MKIDLFGEAVERLRVLSLWQPWATLCVAPDPAKGGHAASKEFETRSWRPHIAPPFRVAIHATKKLDGNILSLLGEWPFRDCLKRCGFYPGDPRPFMKANAAPRDGLKLIPFGAIVGIATIVSVDSTTSRATHFGSAQEDREEYALGDWSDGRYAWGLADTAMLSESIPFSGRQEALYLLPADVERRVLAQLEAAA